MRTTILLLLALTFSPGTLFGGVSEFRSLRIAVIDDSSSMAGASIEAVKRELGAVLQKLPATDEYPVMLVVFGSSADSGILFADNAKAQAFIGRLHGGHGGTDISAGLAQGINEIEKHKSVPDIVVLLYTDGEDGNPSRTLQQEARLDAIFSQRRKQNFDQTVVFCQNWQNSALRSAIVKHGNANVVDTAQRLLTPLSIEPKIILKSATWSLADPTTLDVELECTATPDDQKRIRNISPLSFLCKTAGVIGDPQLTVTSNGRPFLKLINIAVPVDYSTDVIDLEFNVSLVDAQRPGTELAVPKVTRPQMKVSVPLRKRQVEIVTTTSFDFPEPGQWVDPLKLKAEYAVVLNFEVKKRKNSTVDPSGNVRVIADPGTTITKGDEVFRLPGTGKFQVPLTLELSPLNPQEELHRMRFGFGLTLRPESNNPNIVVTPSELHVEYRQLQPPAPFSVALQFAQHKIQAVDWIDLTSQTAFVDTTVLLSTRSPIPEGTLLAISSNQSRKLDYRPKVIRSGRQEIRVRLLARLEPKPSNNRIELDVTPPKPFGAFVFPRIPPVLLQFDGPSPARLVAMKSGNCLEATVADNARHITFDVAPTIQDLKYQQTARGLTVEIAGNGNGLRIPRQSQLPLQKLSSIATTIVPTDDDLFFRDSKRIEQIQVSSNPATSAVIGTTHPVTVRVLAPFKRLAVLLGISLSALAAFVFVVKMFVRLRGVE